MITQVELLKKADPYGHFKLKAEEALGKLFFRNIMENINIIVCCISI